MRWTYSFPPASQMGSFSSLRPELDRWAGWVDGAGASRPTDPPAPDPGLPGYTPARFFFGATNPPIHIPVPLLPAHEADGNLAPTTLPDLLADQGEPIRLTGGLGKTTAMLHAFALMLRDYQIGASSAYLPVWLEPGSRLLEPEQMAGRPPLAIFVDLDWLLPISGEQLVTTLAARAGLLTAAGHRLIIAQRGWRGGMAEAARNALATIFANSYRVAPLDPAQARSEWLARGFTPAEADLLAARLAERNAAAAAPARQTTLPLALTTFVGREYELEQAKAYLADGRLLTITGPGGIGKTRLALQLAAALRDEFADGVYFVPLAALREPVQVVAAIAQALGLRDEAGQSTVALLRDFLIGRRLLLVLDNFEQVVAAAAPVNELIRPATGVKTVVTSRALLHLAGERELPLPPLRLPESADLPTDHAAVRLFLDRAAPDFALTPATAPLLAEILRRVEGIPLAIELVASRTGQRSLRALRDQLANRLDFHPYGLVDLPARQATMEGTIDWSYEMLTAPEQELFRALAVFAGGCSEESAAAVLGPHLFASGDELISLRDRSLLIRQGGGDEPRYTMLETIRDFARRRLDESGAAAQISARHAAYFLALVKSAADLDALAPELDNLREAMDWTLRRTGDRSTGQQLAGLLGPLWQLRGYLGEGREWLRLALQYPGDPPTIASALLAAGTLAWQQGDYDPAGAYLDKSLAMFVALDDGPGQAAALFARGNIARERADYPAAMRSLEASRDLWRALDDRRGLARALSALGNVAADGGDYDQARLLYEQSLSHMHALADGAGIAAALNDLGYVAANGGRVDEAAALLQRSLQMRRSLGDKAGVANVLATLGNLARHSGDYALADKYLGECLALRRELGSQRGIASTLHLYGVVAMQLGDTARAEQLLGESLSLRHALGNRLGEAEVLASQGLLALGRADYARTLALARQSLAIYADLNSQRGIATAKTLLASAELERNHPDEARELYGESLALMTAAGYPRGVAEALEGLARLAAARKKGAHAAILFGAAAALREAIASPLPPIYSALQTRYLAAAQRTITAASWDKSYARGRRMTPAEALAATSPRPKAPTF